MSKTLLASFRIWHRRFASLFFVFFFVIAVTAILLGWKSSLTKTLWEDRSCVVSTDYKNWLPLDSLEKMANAVIMKITKAPDSHPEKIEIRLSKGYIGFLYKGYYSIQLDGLTGKVKLIEQKNGGLIQDIHDGAILDNGWGIKSGMIKKSYSTLMGLTLLIMTITGFYLWYKPMRLRKAKNF